MKKIDKIDDLLDRAASLEGKAYELETELEETGRDIENLERIDTDELTASIDDLISALEAGRVELAAQIDELRDSLDS